MTEMPTPAPISAAAEAPEPTSDAPALTPRVAPWRLFLLLVTTFGLFVIVWAYRQARDLRIEGRSSAHPRSWAILSGLLPLQPWVLLRFARHAADRLRALGLPAGAKPLLVAGLSAVSAVGMMATARWQFFTPAAVFLALSAVPVVLVQRSVNVARVAQGIPEQTRLGWPLRIVSAIGLACLVLAGVGEFRSGNVDRMLGRSLEAGVAVGGKTPGWTLAPPTPGWVRLASGRFGGEDSDLELGHPDGKSWVVVYVTPRGSATLDNSVGMRIAAVREAMGEITAREQRFFFPGLDLVAASHARYARAHGIGPVFHVLNVQGTEAVEVIGFSASPALEGEIEASVRSLRIAPEEAKR